MDERPRAPRLRRCIGARRRRAADALLRACGSAEISRGILRERDVHDGQQASVPSCTAKTPSRTKSMRST
jgi:hypothetical protein